MKRILALMLCLVMCLGAFASCSAKDEQQTGTETYVDDVKESVLPDMDWEGKTVKVGERTPSQYLQSAVFSDDITTPIGRVVYERNSIVKDKYNFEIEAVTLSAPSDTVIKEAQAGECSVDIIIDGITWMKGALAQGVFADLNELDYIDWDASGWDKESNSELSIRNRRFVCTGDMNLREKGGSSVVYVNRNILSGISDEDIRQVVIDGNWTMEMMQKFVKEATEISGSTGETLTYGLVHPDNQMFFNYLQTGYGISIISKDDTDTPYFTFDEPSRYETTVNAIDDLLKMYADRSTTYTQRYSSDTPIAIDLFKSGKALFYTGQLQHITSFVESGSFEFSVFPYPKYSAEQDYVSARGYSSSTLLAIPYYAADLSFSAFALQALNERSSSLTETYVEEQCKLKGSYDDTDYQLMSLALTNGIYDLGIVFNWGAVHVWIFTDRYNDASGIKSIPVSGVNNFATLWAADKALAHKELENFLANFT